MKPESIAKILEIYSAQEKAAKLGNEGGRKEKANAALDLVGQLLRVDLAKMRAAHEAGEPVLESWGYALAAAGIRVAENAPKPQPAKKGDAQ